MRVLHSKADIAAYGEHTEVVVKLLLQLSVKGSHIWDTALPREAP